LSPLAALALVLGLLSPVALVAPVFLVVPAAAVGAGVLALTKIRASDNALTGARLARCGVALAVACTIAAGVRAPVRDSMLRSQAAAQAGQWLTMLAENRVKDAQQYLGSGATSSLGPPPTESGQPPPDPSAAEQIIFERLRDNPLTKQLAGLKPPLTLRAVAGTNVGPIFEGRRTIVGADYAVSSSDEAAGLNVQMRLVRTPAQEAEGRPWRIDHWDILLP
jgi:hypothetical protein